LYGIVPFDKFTNLSPQVAAVFPSLGEEEWPTGFPPSRHHHLAIFMRIGREVVTLRALLSHDLDDDGS